MAIVAIVASGCPDQQGTVPTRVSKTTTRNHLPAATRSWFLGDPLWWRVRLLSTLSLVSFLCLFLSIHFAGWGVTAGASAGAEVSDKEAGCRLSSATLCNGGSRRRLKENKKHERVGGAGRDKRDPNGSRSAGKPKSATKDATKDSKKKGTRYAEKSLPLCVGIRGNGQALWVHFGALARIVETFGVIHGVAGGSSGTITSFLLSSIQGNSGIAKCGGKCCTEEEQRARVSLLLKTTLALSETSNLVAFQEAILPTLLAIRQAQILQRLQGSDTVDQAYALVELLAILEMGEAEGKVPVVNRDFINLLQTSPDPVSHAVDILKSSNGEFKADNFRIFLRPYPFSFLGGSLAVDAVGSFYKFAQLDEFLENCAANSFGKLWNTIRDMAAGPLATTCGAMFDKLYQEYVQQESIPSLLREPLGETVKTLISIGVITGDSADVFRRVQEEYLNPLTPGDPNSLDPNEIIPISSAFDVDFDDVKIGYFGDTVSLQRVKRNIVHFDDAKSQRFLSLGQATWLDALTSSPAEPTLSNGIDLGSDGIGVGGWPDPTPSQVLHSMGCETVVLITDKKGASQFITSVGALLNSKPKDFDDLYNLTRADSGFTTSLQTATAVLCSEWDSIPSTDVQAFIESGYSGPLVTDDTCILSSSEAGASDDQIKGCTPLIA